MPEKMEPTVVLNDTYQPADILLVVPTLNEADHIETCLRSLVDGDSILRGATIVVSDGGSKDGTQSIVQRLAVEYANLHLTHNAGKLQSAGINHAVEAFAKSDTRLLIRCDAHAVYPPNFVSQIVETFARQPEAASVVCVMDAKGNNCFQRAAAWIVDTPFGSGGSAHRGGGVSGWIDHGHHAGFKLDWFRKIGGYDRTFSHNEDAEYDHRLQLAGGKIWLEKDLRLDYEMRSTPSALLRQYWKYGRGRARTILKHRMKPRLRQLVPAINLGLMIVCVLLSPFWAGALLWPALYLCALVSLSLIAVIRMRTFCGINAGVALMLIHNGWAAGFGIEIAKRFGRTN